MKEEESQRRRGEGRRGEGRRGEGRRGEGSIRTSVSADTLRPPIV
jgi:hypothetical protein